MTVHSTWPRKEIVARAAVLKAARRLLDALPETPEIEAAREELLRAREELLRAAGFDDVD